MKNSNLIRDNIDNLTGLWKTVGTPFESYHKKENSEYCKIENSGWPNKLWFRTDISETDAETAIQIMQANSGLVLPYFDIHHSNSNEILEAKGLTVKTEQVAMALRLEQKFKYETNLHFKRVTNEQDAKIWADLYPEAFGYEISKEILIRNYNQVSFYLFSLENQPIGTCMLFQTGNNIGIHGVGVIPEMRRKGFAEAIMKFALNRSIDLKAEYALLQASAMGKDIYTRLGFADLFVIKNYIL
ncbi:GNAT family N-acetyltransferase [Flavobacterium circumlabens]|uniref:Acetyltransferase (GNAT) family protein n=1 Tax=Flavobacterium circumlabens TaxID=2133765 RepID=A0A4Y7UA94_9FLAO|nr:GNAT family N-acetyltransferase [Flavobacterium circumlabens]TCN54545.1 acetyltransferase (GNAT) family protein [Flavobacterium circumlabens]TEB42749.1 GNAT family N-acetyltransferase [Flavobacterium circumlabens]